ncbi:GNAT family N-acetyltransferase [Rugosibacter aromaticivorans]|uniref:GNAT family N-acetyltransferase n=1 Tax=Rugosibacter aromaticivorans TaxID=1565605 RepID=UPI00192A5548|nr:GNAT family N-acetyltransferase [Rugosibacter aromaticivorans]
MTSFTLDKNLHIRRIDELTAEEVAVWDQLLLADDLRRAFMSHRYARVVAETGGDVVVLVLYDTHTPCGFLPLQRIAGLRGKVGIFEPVGDVMTDYFGLIAADGVHIRIEKLLAATHGRVNAVLFSHLDETQSRFGLVGEEPRTGLRTWLCTSLGTSLETPASDYWVNLRKSDKKLVYDTERREKKLINEIGPVTFEWTSQNPASDMAWLIESKKAQYTRTGKGQAPLFDSRKVALLNRLLQSQEENCQGVLSALRCDKEIIAGHFGLRCYDMLHVWFPVYSPQYSIYSPGRVLFKYLLAAASHRGVRVFDRGEGDAQAKRDFANEEHSFTRGLWHVAGWKGLRVRVALGTFWRMSRWSGQ